MERTLSQDFLNRVELHFEQLLPEGMSKAEREQAKKLIRPLYNERASAKTVSRFLCAVSAKDPAVCLRSLEGTPQASRTKEARQPAARVELPEPGRVKLAHPRSSRTRPTPPPVAAASKLQRNPFVAPGATAAPTARPMARWAAPSAVPPVSLKPINAPLGWHRDGARINREQPVTWKPEAEDNAFVLVLGGSGSGKTELVRVLAARSTLSVPVIVLDFHGDLVGLPIPGYSAGRAAGSVAINPLTLASQDLEAGGPRPQAEAVVDAVRRAAPGFGRVQEVTLRDSLMQSYKAAGVTEDPATWGNPAPRLSQVRDRLGTTLRDPDRKADARSLSGVLAAIDVAFSDAAFSGEGELPLAGLLRHGGRFDLSHLSRPAKILAADTLLRQIFEKLRSAGVATGEARYRVLVIVDEASLLRGAAILDELFKEARKYGLAMVLASQEAADFSESVRSNAATRIVLKTHSAKEATANSRELSGVKPADILALEGRGDGYLRDHLGTRRIQVAPFQTVVESAAAPTPEGVVVPPGSRDGMGATYLFPQVGGKGSAAAKSPEPWEQVAPNGKTPYVVISVAKNGNTSESGAATEAAAIAYARFVWAKHTHTMQSVMVSGPRGWVNGWGPGSPLSEHRPAQDVSKAAAASLGTVAKSEPDDEPPGVDGPAAGSRFAKAAPAIRAQVPEAPLAEPPGLPAAGLLESSPAMDSAAGDYQKRYGAGRVWIAGKTKKPPGKGQLERWAPIVAAKLAASGAEARPENQGFWEGVRDFLAEAQQAGPAGLAAGRQPAERGPAAAQPLNRSVRVAKLRKLAESLRQQIDELRDSGTHHQRPTARRARIAAGQDTDAERLAQVRNALLGLADALEGNCAPAMLQGADQGERNCLPESLAGIDTKLLIEELLRTEKFPSPGIQAHWLKELLAAASGKTGLAAERRAAEKVKGRCNDHWCGIQDLGDVAAIEKLAALLRANPKTRRDAEFALGYIMPFKRALAGGLHSQQEWTQARTDLQNLAKPTPQASPKERQIRDEERALIGVKLPGYFPTPKTLAARVVQEANLMPGLRVLEPSAGKGDIAAAVRAAGVEPEVIELNDKLRGLLELKGFRVVGNDFLEHTGEYDRVLMNPPFEDNQDIVHVQHAYELLVPGGRVVAIMGEGAFFRQGRTETEFRRWLEARGGTSEKLPTGSFQSSDRPTGVATRLVILDKPAVPTPGGSSPPPAAAPPPGAVNIFDIGKSTPSPARPRASQAQKPAASCPAENPACSLGLLGGACGLPAALVLAAPAGAPVPQTARYCLARAAKLTASHDPISFAPRADYPAGVQERRYEADKGEQLKVLLIAQRLNPALIFNTSPSVTDGTPVVTGQGIALGGNGRTLGLQRHYLEGLDVAKPYLVAHASEFGFSPDQIEAIADPVVVRVVDPGTTGLTQEATKRRLQALVRVLNVPLTKDLDQQASAVALARQLDDGVFTVLAAALDDDKTLAEYLHSPRSRDLVRELQRVGVLRETNLSGYIDAGGFTEAGRRLVEKILAAALIEEAAVLEALGEQTQATLARGAPWLIAATAYGAEWDVRPAFLAAGRDLVAMRRAQIRTAAEYLRQDALFSSEEPPLLKVAGGRIILQVLSELAAAPLRFARFARSYCDDARQNLSSQAALFAAEKVSPADALRRAATAAGVTSSPT